MDNTKQLWQSMSKQRKIVGGHVKRIRNSIIKTIATTSAVREVHRNIIQEPDGTVRTVEFEKSKERIIIQQEEMHRELECAKDSYSRRICNEAESMLKGWGGKGTLSHTKRRKSLLRNLTRNTIPRMHGYKSIQQILAIERATLVGTVHDFRNMIDREHLNYKIACHFKQNVNGGSRYFIDSIIRTTMRDSRIAQINSFKQRLLQEEVEYDHSLGMREIHLGLFEKCDAPCYPLTDQEMEVMDHLDPDMMGTEDPAIYDKYTTLSLNTNGEDSALLVPVLEQLITCLLILQLGGNSCPTWARQMALPELVDITNVKKKRFTEFAFCPTDFFGDYNEIHNKSQHFGECEFRVGDEVFEKVNIEYPLLVQTEAYADFARQVFVEIAGKSITREMNCINTAGDMLAQYPEELPEFAKLKQVKQGYDYIRDRDEQEHVVTQKHKELIKTLKLLKRKANML
jgi:hypothetical protein